MRARDVKTYKSNDDLFRSVNDLMGRLRGAGLDAAAVEIRDGFRCLNGMTDGWALFMESLERTLGTHASTMSNDAANELRAILHTVYELVYR